MIPTAGSTPDEILAVALGKLALRPEVILADIGCGTGKVSLAAAPQVREVLAVDRRPEAIAHAREQARKAMAANPAIAGRTTDVGNATYVGNIRFVEGEAPEALENLPPPDRAFIGGSRQLSRVIAALASAGTARMVVSCVRIETLAEAVSAMRGAGIFREALLLQVARSRDLSGGTYFVPGNPVFLVVGGADPCS